MQVQLVLNANSQFLFCFACKVCELNVVISAEEYIKSINIDIIQDEVSLISRYIFTETR